MGSRRGVVWCARACIARCLVSAMIRSQDAAGDAAAPHAQQRARIPGVLLQCIEVDGSSRRPVRPCVPSQPSLLRIMPTHHRQSSSGSQHSSSSSSSSSSSTSSSSSSSSSSSTSSSSSQQSTRHAQASSACCLLVNDEAAAARLAAGAAPRGLPERAGGRGAGRGATQGPARCVKGWMDDGAVKSVKLCLNAGPAPSPPHAPQPHQSTHTAEAFGAVDQSRAVQEIANRLTAEL